MSNEGHQTVTSQVSNADEYRMSTLSDYHELYKLITSSYNYLNSESINSFESHLPQAQLTITCSSSSRKTNVVASRCRGEAAWSTLSITDRLIDNLVCKGIGSQSTTLLYALNVYFILVAFQRSI